LPESYSSLPTHLSKPTPDINLNPLTAKTVAGLARFARAPE
jgi:hypothetical protein